MMDDQSVNATVRPPKEPSEWFAHRLRLLFESIIVQLPHALDPEQVEGIHAMRVATRRLRSAFRDVWLFLDSHPSKRAARDIKALADALGEVRDEDVAIGEYERLGSECDDPRISEGISALIVAHQERREAAFSDLQKELSVDFQQNLRHSFETLLEDVLTELAKHENTSVPSIGRSVIGSRLDELTALGIGLHNPFDQKTLHDARIATKRLRYAIDLFSECWNDTVKPFSVECARMQGFLGDAHDRDIWIDSLYRMIKSRKRSTDADNPEFDVAAWMISEYIRERTKKYREGLKLWSEWRVNGFGRSLSKAISTE